MDLCLHVIIMEHVRQCFSEQLTPRLAEAKLFIRSCLLKSVTKVEGVRE